MWAWFDISPVFTDFSQENNEKMVSSEPSNLREK
jgi:hypothetical protein